MEIGDKPKSSASHGNKLLYVYDIHNFKPILFLGKWWPKLFLILGHFFPGYIGQNHMAPFGQKIEPNGNNEQHCM